MDSDLDKTTLGTNESVQTKFYIELQLTNTVKLLNLTRLPYFFKWIDFHICSFKAYNNLYKDVFVTFSCS